MPEIGPVAAEAIVSGGVNSASDSLSITLTSPSSVNTKGSWVELIAATEFDANWIEVDITGCSTANLNYAVDISVGAAADEQVIVPDLWVNSRAGQYSGLRGGYLFPVFIPAGSRIAARMGDQSALSQTCQTSIRIGSQMLLGSTPPPFVTSYGWVGSGSRGTNIDPGGTINTDVVVEYSSATPFQHRWLGLGIFVGDTSIGSTQHAWRFQVLVGAATEAKAIPDIHVSTGLTDDAIFLARCMPAWIPKGTRLAVSARCNDNTDSDRDTYVALYGAG